MKKLIVIFSLPLIIYILTSCTANRNNAIILMKLSNHWYLKSSLEVPVPDSIVSTQDFKLEAWYQTTVPSTVLGALVKNKVYPDPLIGTNNFIIPDVSDTFNARHDLAKYSYLKNKANPWKDPYWYRKEFTIPRDCKGKEVWLNFNSINYRADIWLNGHQIADKNEVVGMFLRFKFNISRYVKIGEPNYLAVKIYQVDHPGTPDPGTQFEVFGAPRGHAVDIYKDETLKFSGGWDCAPVVRDRNMGICQDVYITTTGPVFIENPYIITDLPLPDTTKADLKITTEITNISDNEITSQLTGIIDLVNILEFPVYNDSLDGSMSQFRFTKNVSFKAHETKTVEINSNEFPQLVIQNPHLWWPNGYGKQYLYNLNLVLSINGKTSDKANTTFGIREVSNELKKIGNEYGRVFYINGKRIFCRGGWLQPDALLDLNMKRVYNEARLLAKANVNMVANEDAPAPPEIVMDSYDKYGLMAWETFYQCWRMYPGTDIENNPLDHGLALREAQDIIKRYRNHPCLVIWCAANETTVAEDIYIPLRKYIFELDGTRPFIPASNISWNVDKLTPYIKGDLPLGTTDDGDPDYTWNPEPYYFNKILEVNKQTFRNELGSPALPVYSSLTKFITGSRQDKNNPLFPLDSIWAEHGAWDLNGYAFKKYDNAIRTIYGKPSSIEDYAKKAQYVNATSYRAMFEAANHRMWDITSGVMLWKLNSCWPDVCWQFYDWYLCPNAAYYFSKKAMEPIHIQLNANNSIISVINARHAPLKDVEISARLIDFQMQTKWTYSEKCTIEADSYREFTAVPKFNEHTSVYFVQLRLKNKEGVIISENLYWFPSAPSADMSILARLQPIDLDMTASGEKTGKEYRIIVYVKNNSGRLSFFNRLQITRGFPGEEVLPSFWDDNFITLFPSEEKVTKVIVAIDDLGVSQPYLSIDGSSQNPVKIEF
jgi:hypothetical protein